MNEYDYTPTEIEDEMFLTDVPLSITKHAIEAQFDNPLDNRKKDYVGSFIDRYNYSKKYLNNEEEEDERAEIDLIYDNFIGFMVKIFDDMLDISFPEIEDMGYDDQGQLIHLTYRFFIKDMKKNFANFILNYINDNKDDIVDELPETKDITSVSFRLETIDDDDITILSNLDIVIDSILDKDFNVDEFLDLCHSDSYSLEREFVIKKFDSFEIVGNFWRPYVSMIDPGFKTELQSKVRNKILKKYPKRQIEVDEEAD